jgi:hypothetical protein
MSDFALAVEEAIVNSIKEALDNEDFTDAIERAVENHDFDDAIATAVSDALEDFDFDDKIAEAVNDYVQSHTPSLTETRAHTSDLAHMYQRVVALEQQMQQVADLRDRLAGLQAPSEPSPIPEGQLDQLRLAKDLLDRALNASFHPQLGE